MKPWDIVADIGGTNTRLAARREGAISEVEVFETTGPDGVLGAIRSYLAARAAPRRGLFAVAGPVVDGGARLTNGGQLLATAALTEAIGAPAAVANDFEAAAWALATVGEEETEALQGPVTPPPGLRLLIGPGTGLGVAGLVPHPNGWAALPSEGGHIGISPVNDEEIEVFRAVARRWPEARFGDDPLRIEAEAILSGSGLPVLYAAVADALGEAGALTSPAEILADGRARKSAAAGLTIAIFKRRLASVAGDLATAFNAAGGVYIAGGVATRNPWLFDDDFVASFNLGGRLSAFRRKIPVYRYLDGRIGLIGAGNLIDALDR